jgi:hypothetical protein
MSELTCEIVCMELMARRDGQPPSLSPGTINGHLASCALCREEAEAMIKLEALLDSQRRRVADDDLWPLLEHRLNAEKGGSGERTTLYSFSFLGAALALYKLFELLPERRIDIAFKLIPVIITISLFAYLKENPFKVNARLGAGSELKP